MSHLIWGLDLGSGSVGWAVLSAKTEKGKLVPTGIVDAGVRIFEAGMSGTPDEYAAGKEESRATARRDARLRRRQLARRRRRRAKVFHQLQRMGLLPQEPASKANERHAILEDLDKKLGQAALSGMSPEQKRIAGLTWLYDLRASALDRALQPFQLGRALYQLSQRRGFLSNRRSAVDKDEDLGVVKEGIVRLQQEMTATGSRTLGEYFSKLNPEDARIRGRWTARGMFTAEFDAIVAAQSEHHACLRDGKAVRQLRSAIFHQRPLRSQKDLIGRCELEPLKRRCARARPVAQRFRYWQRLHDLRYRGSFREDWTELTLEQKHVLAEHLELNERATWKKVRDLLDLRKVKFNFEAAKERSIRGNSTIAMLATCWGDGWAALGPAKHDEIAEDLLSIQSAELLERRALHHGFPAAGASELSTTFSPEDDYGQLSSKAMKKLLGRMIEGLSYSDARAALYEERVMPTHDVVPPLAEIMPDLRNPSVARVLTELRKVANSLVREHGIPDKIHLELGRDLKRGRKLRAKIDQRNRKRRKQRDQARQRALEAGITRPKRDDINKVLLADECDWTCPFTGRPFGMTQLLGSTPDIDLEHIVPYSKSMDNSYGNLTLCYASENRNHKRNRTPFEAYSGNPARFDEILDRVARFKGDGKRKLTRFRAPPDQVAKMLGDFTTRQLNDTRHATVLARDYLGTLFGAQAGVADGSRVIVTLSGGATATVRRALRMNNILGLYAEKTRDDHRHHAVDAIAIALTNQAMIQEIAKRARKRETEWERPSTVDLDEPWPAFRESVKRVIDPMYVSLRPNRKVNGQLTKDTNFADPAGKAQLTVRKRLDGMTAADLKKIADPATLQLVERRLAELGKRVPKDAFGDPANLPVDSQGRFVKAVRLTRTGTPVKVGETRWVENASNHHAVIYRLTVKGREKVSSEVVSTLEAMRRIQSGRPVVERDTGDGREFVCTLRGGDVIYLPEGKYKEGLYRVRSVWHEGAGARFTIHALNDARLQKDMKASKQLFKPTAASIAGLFKKVEVLPSGKIVARND